MKKAEKLLKKYNAGTATAEERAIVEQWYLKYKTSPSDLKEEELLEEYHMGFEKMQQSIGNKKVAKIGRRIAVAASLLFCIGMGWYFFHADEAPIQAESTALLLPETNTAVLTLANGTKINIRDGNVGEIGEEQGIKISQTADGQLVYTITERNKRMIKGGYNTIETPIGSQYTVVLPDGSKVWLSSASKLRYPVHFSEKERKVALTGEAYFEVKSSYSATTARKIPFIVSSRNQQVEVLGTQFNVSAYPDDVAIKTALVEGSVKVSLTGDATGSGVLLKPGQMSVTATNSDKIRVDDIDINDIKAWREGYFIFNNENIVDIMQKLSKWYGFQVEYRGDMTDLAFQGNYLRTRDLSNLLETIEMTNKVKFEISNINNERRVIVIRKK
ncbi:DUF4974 domain-containing protein [Sphingobacterium sp. SGG-5]|uniref:FecR family protein n=1 Tax=Sphingobacterium sp. SGG-5 TaxID=2710881 RepID=UPI0013EDDC7B|nr:FecR family protein [Sphingobacterium sp. SGG-5]NGM62152.1 DUF4974 domain-containing protein [Sphingobacterium sp. SGG-5]